MTLRAFYSSPLHSYAGELHHAIEQAVLGLMRIRHAFRPVWSCEDVRHTEVNCVWTPLVEGDIIRAQSDGFFTESAARGWCIDALSGAGFNCLIRADTIPRRPGAESFCDAEEAWCRQHGLQIISDVDVIHGTWADKSRGNAEGKRC